MLHYYVVTRVQNPGLSEIMFFEACRCLILFQIAKADQHGEILRDCSWPGPKKLKSSLCQSDDDDDNTDMHH